MRALRLTLVVLLLLIGASSCRTATEITLNIRTDIPCEEVDTWQGVAVYLGKPGAESADQAPTLVTKHCEGDGNIGTLVVVPSGDKDEAVGVRVVAGITQSPEGCLESGYQGCIVARRSVRFTPHFDLRLDVALTSQCKDIGCDPAQSCTAKVCIDSSATPTAPPPGVPSVRCGDDGLFCPTTGDVCCLSVDVAAGRTQGACMLAERCPNENIVLNCDDDSDCPRGGFEDNWSGICALSAEDDGDPYRPTRLSLSACRVAVFDSVGQHTGFALCQDKDSCADGAFSCGRSTQDSNLLPGYYWCKFVLN